MYYVDSLVMRARLIRWSAIFFQFCFSLDHFCSFVNGQLHFPFSSSCILFFERFQSIRLTLIIGLPSRPRTNAHMNTLGKLFPERDQLEWSCSVVKKDICDFLASEDDHDILDLVLYPYVGMDWKGCANI